MRKTRTALDKLKAKYDNKTVLEIEQEAEGCNTKSLEARKNFILTLYYLERTNRFRENKQYRDSTFEAYIYYRFHLRHGTYEKERIAFIIHEKESIRFGAPLVIKARKACGPLKVTEVFSKVKTTDPPEKINKVIEKYARPVKPKPVKIHTPTATEEQLRKENNELRAELKEREEQIEKLKATVEKYRGLYETQLSLNNDFHAAIAPLIPKFGGAKVKQASRLNA